MSVPVTFSKTAATTSELELLQYVFAGVSVLSIPSASALAEFCRRLSFLCSVPPERCHATVRMLKIIEEIRFWV